MTAPRYDRLQQDLPATASFTTSFEVLNYSQAAVQVIWTGFNNTNAEIRLRASNDDTYFQNLTAEPVTMVASSSNHVFNVYQISYGFMQVYFNPGSNTSGTLSIKTIRKAFA